MITYSTVSVYNVFFIQEYIFWFVAALPLAIIFKT